MDFDIAIIGSGPAGASCFHHLSDDFKIAWIDSEGEKRDKLCGGLLNRESVEIINHSKYAGLSLISPDSFNSEVALPHQIFQRPSKAKLNYRDFDNNLHYQWTSEYVNVDRVLFDKYLIASLTSKSKKERQSFFGYKSSEIQKENRKEGWAIKLTNNRDTRLISTTMVVDASGWRAIGKKTFNTKPSSCYFGVQLFIPGKCYSNGYQAIFHKDFIDFFGWIIPKSRGTEIGACYCKKDFLKTGFIGLLTFCLTKFPFIKVEDDEISYLLTKRNNDIDAVFRNLKIRGCPIFWLKDLREIYLGNNNLFIAGEAAGLVSPSSGDGISFALKSGIGLANVINQVALNSEKQSFQKKISKEILRRYQNSLRSSMNELAFNIKKSRVMVNTRKRYLTAKYIAPFLGAKPYREE